MPTESPLRVAHPGSVPHYLKDEHRCLQQHYYRTNHSTALVVAKPLQEHARESTGGVLYRFEPHSPTAKHAKLGAGDMTDASRNMGIFADSALAVDATDIDGDMRQGVRDDGSVFQESFSQFVERKRGVARAQAFMEGCNQILAARGFPNESIQEWIALGCIKNIPSLSGQSLAHGDSR